MSDLIGSPEDKFSLDVAQVKSRKPTNVNVRHKVSVLNALYSLYLYFQWIMDTS